MSGTETNGAEHLKSARRSDDDRTTAISLYNFAHSYWASASVLQASDVNATRPHAPVNYLYFHAIELFLKAHLRMTGLTVAEIKLVGHNMEKLASKAEELGLSLTESDFEVIKLVGENYLPMRCIQVGPLTIATTEALWGTCSWLFDTIGDGLLDSGVTKRLPPRPAHPSDAEIDGKPD